MPVPSSQAILNQFSPDLTTDAAISVDPTATPSSAEILAGLEQKEQVDTQVNTIAAQPQIAVQAPTPTAPSPQDETVALSAAKGGYDMLAHIIGGPVDLVNAAISMLPSYTTVDPVSGQETEVQPGEATGAPFLGSKHVRDLFTWLGATNVEADTYAEHVAERVGAEVVGVAPMILGGVGAMMTRPTATPIPTGQGVDTFRRIVRGYVDQYRRNPVMASTTEVGGAVGSGVGIGTVDYLYANDETTSPYVKDIYKILAGMTGGLTGGIAPPVVVLGARVGTSPIRGVRNLVTGESATRQVITQHVSKDMVVEAVGGPSAADEMVRKLDAYNTATLGAPTPTTVGVLNHPGLVTLEAEMVKRNPVLLEKLSASRVDHINASNNALAALDLDEIGPEVITAAIKQRVDKMTMAADRRIENLRQALVENRETYATPEEYSLDAANLVTAGRAQYTKDSEILYGTRDRLATEQNAVIDGALLFNGVKKNLDAQGKASNIDPAVNKLHKDIIAATSERGKPSARVPFKELLIIQKRVNAEIRTARSAAKNPDSAGHSTSGEALEELAVLKTSVEDTLEAMTDYPDVLDATQIAKQYTVDNRAKYKNPSINTNFPVDVYAKPDSAALERLLSTPRTQTADIDAFIVASGNEAKAVASIENYMIASLWDSAADVDGTLRLTDFNHFKTNKVVKKLLTDGRFPGLREKLGSIETATAEVLAVKGAMTRRLDNIRSGATRFLLDNRPEEAVESMMKSKFPAKAAGNIRQMLRHSPEAQEGFKALIWDNITRKTQPTDYEGFETLGQIIRQDPGKFTLEIEKHINTFRAAGFDHEHIKNMKTAVRMMQTTKNTAQHARFDAGELLNRARTPLEKLGEAIPMQTVLSLAYGIKRGVIGVGFASGYVGSRILRSQVENLNDMQINSVLSEFFINPEFAKKMLTPTKEMRLVPIKFRDRVIKRTFIQAYLIEAGMMEIEDSEEIKQVDSGPIRFRERGN